MSRIASTAPSLPRFKDDIHGWEEPWMALYPLLTADGYALRDRYNPDWTPRPSSAIKKAISFGIQTVDVPWQNRVWLEHGRVMDATRLADGLRVMIKAIDTDQAIKQHEWNMARIFLHRDLIADPRNHCIPTIDYVRYPGTQWELLVTPQMYPFHVIPFETFGEIADFVHQLLEGVAFMHAADVPHRDIGPLNLTMFSPDLFPNGTSALYPGQETDIISPDSKYRARRDVYVRYYIIDFGLSWSFKSKATRQSLPVTLGQYKDLPEYATNTYCNSFAVDVWCIGKLIQEEFGDVSRVLSFERVINLDILIVLAELLSSTFSA
ncbi:hypothetical protein AURDEDRAFT_156430 [Auricularia subglabra TFB-10046 SS5]|nr:hypothetical protein AURDEDRAFT_156430 [Auricularia subglabra TFB-10046 SS5]